MELTKNELQFLTVLWRSEVPMTAPEVLEKSTERTWAERSLHGIINNLLAKGAIAEYGIIKEGRNTSRTFIPVLSHEDYYSSVLEECESKELLSLISAAIRKRSDIEDETVDELESIVQKWKGK